MATLEDHGNYVDLNETGKYIPFLDWISPALICVFGAILVVFGFGGCDEDYVVNALGRDGNDNINIIEVA